ncbi:MAG TPA: tetratricopeptide repeat protein, partial [Armatimonadetes bacterium]|nr:tetratricopeptide repeat protein [Armatimonadota bacterium]
QHHIGYAMSAMDLIDDALYIGGAMALGAGQCKEARDRLKQLVDNYPTSELYIPAAFLLARTYELLGDTKRAIRLYRLLLTRYPDSGLSDDIETLLCALEQRGDSEGCACANSMSKWMTIASERLGIELSDCTVDIYEGKNVVVLAPFLISPRLRQYNLPNIWDVAVDNLTEWTGNALTREEPLLIVLANNGAGRTGNPIVLSATAVGDPPKWQLGFYELTRTFLSTDGIKWDVLGEVAPLWLDAFARLGAGALQYNLVSETRDAIGSPSAVKLAHEDVLRMRERALKALEQYVRDGADISKLNPQVATGMLIYLLEANGYGRELVDWSPYQRFFNYLRTVAQRDDSPAYGGSWVDVLGEAFRHAFRTDLSALLSSWGLPIRSARR